MRSSMGGWVLNQLSIPPRKFNAGLTMYMDSLALLYSMGELSEARPLVDGLARCYFSPGSWVPLCEPPLRSAIVKSVIQTGNQSILAAAGAMHTAFSFSCSSGLTSVPRGRQTAGAGITWGLRVAPERWPLGSSTCG